MLEELRAEYRSLTIGPLLLERLRGLVETQLRHRDPMIYAHASNDYRDGLDDVLNEFTLQVLLGEGQLAYFFDVAVTVDDFDRLTNFQLRRFLARTRQRSIVDNLVERSVRVMLADPAVVISGDGSNRRFKLASLETGSENRGEVSLAHAAAIAAAVVPKIYSNPDDRNPKVYTDESLRTLLRIFLSEVRSAVGRRELQELFDLLLTPWTATVLGLEEAVGDERSDLTPEEQVMVNSIAERIVTTWSDSDVCVFRYKLGNLSDAQLATRLGVSRPTAASEKSRVFLAIRNELEGLGHRLQTAVLTAIARLTEGVTR